MTDRDGAIALTEVHRDNLATVANTLVNRAILTRSLPMEMEGILNATVGIVKRSERQFKVMPKRRVVERGSGWLEKCRRLWKNCERQLNTSLQMAVSTFVALLLRRR